MSRDISEVQDAVTKHFFLLLKFVSESFRLINRKSSSGGECPFQFNTLVVASLFNQPDLIRSCDVSFHYLRKTVRCLLNLQVLKRMRM